MPAESLIPGLLIALGVAAFGGVLLAARAKLGAALLTANHHRQLMDPYLITALIMLIGVAALALGIATSGYFVLRLLDLHQPGAA